LALSGTDAVVSAGAAFWTGAAAGVTVAVGAGAGTAAGSGDATASVAAAGWDWLGALVVLTSLRLGGGRSALSGIGTAATISSSLAAKALPE
jgi:hypothetical protein